MSIVCAADSGIPDSAGRAVAQDRAVAAGEHRGHAHARARQLPMTHRVYASVQRIQPATRDAVVDGIEGEPERGELPARAPC
jgi:hypothetical protein